MQILFAAVLVLNFLTEALAAATLISAQLGAGQTSTATLAAAGNVWSMHYGFAVLAVASISLWVWPRRTSIAAVTPALGFLMTFHAALVVSLAIAADQLAGLAIHSVLAVACVILFTLRTKWCR